MGGQLSFHRLKTSQPQPSAFYRLQTPLCHRLLYRAQLPQTKHISVALAFERQIYEVSLNCGFVKRPANSSREKAKKMPKLLRHLLVFLSLFLFNRRKSCVLSWQQTKILGVKHRNHSLWVYWVALNSRLFYWHT